MAPKTASTDRRPEEYLATLESRRREEAAALLTLMRRVTGQPAVMWGDSIIGFGVHDYTYESGRSGRWFLTGFAPRKAAMTVYIMPGFARYADHLARLGKHKHSVSCLYLPRLANVDMGVLEAMIADSVRRMREIYGAE